MPTPNPPQPQGPLVVALLYDGLCTFEFGIVAEIFGLARPEMGPGWYRFASCAIEKGPLRAHGGFRILADGGTDLIDEADLIVAPGWKGVDVPVPLGLVEQLRRRPCARRSPGVDLLRRFRARRDRPARRRRGDDPLALRRRPAAKISADRGGRDFALSRPRWNLHLGRQRRRHRLDDRNRSTRFRIGRSQFGGAAHRHAGPSQRRAGAVSRTSGPHSA